MKHTNNLKKFIKRNEFIIEKLNEFISLNRDNILSIYTSYAVFEWIVELEKGEIVNEIEYYFSYYGVVGFANDFCENEDIHFIMKNGGKSLKFDIPCICGIYSNEPHP